MNFIWQEVVIEERTAAVSHYGKTGALKSTTLPDARAEVDQVRPLDDPKVGACCRIIEAGRVVATRFFDRDSNRIRWS